MIYKRILCVLLAVVLLFTWPGFVPEAQAVAGIDDATIAVGLLFATWAGVTFASSQGAYMAVSNFLSSSAAGLKAASEVATNYVVDGSLKLVQGVKDAFSSFLSEINSTFITADGSNSGAVSGAVPVGVPLSLVSFDSKNDALSSDSNIVFPGTGFEKTAATVITASGAVKVSIVRDNEIIRSKIIMPSGYSTTNFLMAFGGVPSIVSFSFYVVSSRYLYARITTKFNGYVSTDNVIAYDANGQGGITSASALLSDADAISFERSSTINGTQATNAFASATDLPDTVYGDDRDRSLDIGAVAGVVAGGLAGSTVRPGLDPEQVLEDLKKALGGSLVVPIPTEAPEPSESTEPTETTEPVDTPVVPVSPGFLSTLIGDLKLDIQNAFDGLQKVVEGIPPLIETIIGTVTQGFIDLGTWFEDLLEMLHQFFSETFPNWMQELREWFGSFFSKLEALFISVFTKLFVPSPGYWDAKITACKEAFPLFDAIITTGQGLGGFFSGLGARPPVIYIDLGSSNSWSIGGRQVFLDLTWYAQYKPTVDAILSGFLWLLFAWRFFLRLPGLLRGEAGTIDRLNTYMSSKHSKDGE